MFKEKYFDIEKGLIYLNSASNGIIPKNGFIKANEYLSLAAKKGDMELMEYFRIIKETRNNVAKLINASSKSIGLTFNTTHSVQLIKNAYSDIRNIIIYKKSFPCTEIPFLYDKRYKITVVSGDLKRLENDLIKAKRAIVFLDMVNFLTGELVDIEDIYKITQKHSSLLAVDAMQCVGYFPFDIKKIKADFIFTGSSKWLMGSQGAGFIYVDEPHIERIGKNNCGWLSLDYKNFGVFEKLPNLKNDASAVESGTKNMFGIIIMNESIKILLEIGIKNVYEYNMNGVLKLLKLIENHGSLTQNENCIKTPIISLKCKNAKEFHSYLKEHNVIASYRDGHVRFLYHIYNEEDDVIKLEDIIRGFKIGFR